MVVFGCTEISDNYNTAKKWKPIHSTYHLGLYRFRLTIQVFLHHQPQAVKEIQTEKHTQALLRTQIAWVLNDKEEHRSLSFRQLLRW